MGRWVTAAAVQGAVAALEPGLAAAELALLQQELERERHHSATLARRVASGDGGDGDAGEVQSPSAAAAADLATSPAVPAMLADALVEERIDLLEDHVGLEARRAAATPGSRSGVGGPLQKLQGLAGM